MQRNFLQPPFLATSFSQASLDTFSAAASFAQTQPHLYVGKELLSPFPSSQEVLCRAWLPLRTTSYGQVHPSLPFLQPPSKLPYLPGTFIIVSFSCTGGLHLVILFLPTSFQLSALWASFCLPYTPAQVSACFSSINRSRK